MNNDNHSQNQKLTRNAVFNGNKEPNPKNSWGRLIALLVLVVVLMGGAYAAKAFFTVTSTVDNAYHANGKVSKKISQKKPVSLLILGVDTGIEGRTDRGNSDTMILATVNRKRKQATLTSIPRDLLAEIKNTKSNEFYMSKVNSAFNLNGIKAATSTVSEMLNVPVDYYVEVDMKALENLVDAVSGIDVEVPFDFTYNTTFKKGTQHLTGGQALDYARMRKEDPKGDYGRQIRQRQVIEAIIAEGTSLNSVTNYQKILKVIEKYVKTNLTFNDMMNLVLNYRGAASNIKSDYIQGHDAWIGGSAYQVAQTSELRRVSNELRLNLGLEKVQLKNELTRQNSLQQGLDWNDLNAFYNYIIYDKNSDTLPWQG